MRLLNADGVLLIFDILLERETLFYRVLEHSSMRGRNLYRDAFRFGEKKDGDKWVSEIWMEL